jgi:F420-dependent oxidoreductase-like protein
LIRFGVKTSQAREYGDYNVLRRVWLEAERLGFHSGWLFDHLFELPGVGPSKEPCLECWTTLSALAVETTRLRLGVTVICNNYRNPALLAKMASTLDLISCGRLEFGIGSGWAEVEHKAYGYPFDKPAIRIGKLREAVKIIEKMWTEEETSFHGRYYDVNDAVNNPKPIQKPHPPIWIGGGGEGITLKAIAELADGCNFIGLSPEEYRHKMGVLEAHCVKVDREFGKIQKSWQGRIMLAENEAELKEKCRRYSISDASHNIVGTPEKCVERINEYTDLGVTCFMLSFPEAARETRCLETFSDKVMPEFNT